MRLIGLHLGSVWFAAAMAFAASAHAAAPMVYSTIEPSQIVMGDSAQLTITSMNGGMGHVPLPVVPGLQFEFVTETHQIEITNGTTLASTSVVVQVTPQMAGDYVIPGVTPKSQPLVLHVLPANARSRAASPASPSGAAPVPGVPATPPVLAGGAAANGIRMAQDGAAFVRLILPKKEVYVGESVPVEIEVGLRAGVVTSLNDLPKLTGGDFTLNNLSHQPEREERMIDGKQFSMLTWHSVLAAVKPGVFSMSVETPITVRVRTGSPLVARLDDMLGDPFLQNFFGATVQKDVKVASPAADLTVLALPSAGRPADFSGAVGEFKISSDIAPAVAAAGDPFTLRMHVSGSGNFDRVDSPMLDHVDGWKTYPPKASFSATDAVGHKGEKIFEQPLIAAKPGAQTVPGLAFSYFNPATRRYETARSAPLKVTISPSPDDGSLTAAQLRASTAGRGAAPAANNGLRPDHAPSDSTASSLLPFYAQPRFLAVPSLLALACASAWLGLRRRASGPDSALPKRAQSEATIRVIAPIESAASRGDSRQFFQLARAALQRVCADDGEVRELYALADEAEYSAQAPADAEFSRWIDLVRQRLTENES